MNNMMMAAAVERLMNRVDYYLHCELDGDYEHSKPEHARLRLEHALREELLKIHAEGFVAGIRGAGNAQPEVMAAAGGLTRAHDVHSAQSTAYAS